VADIVCDGRFGEAYSFLVNDFMHSRIPALFVPIIVEIPRRIDSN